VLRPRPRISRRPTSSPTPPWRRGEAAAKPPSVLALKSSRLSCRHRRLTRARARARSRRNHGGLEISRTSRRLVHGFRDRPPGAPQLNPFLAANGILPAPLADASARPRRDAIIRAATGVLERIDGRHQRLTCGSGSEFPADGVRHVRRALARRTRHDHARVELQYGVDPANSTWPRSTTSTSQTCSRLPRDSRAAGTPAGAEGGVHHAPRHHARSVLRLLALADAFEAVLTLGDLTFYEAGSPRL